MARSWFSTFFGGEKKASDNRSESQILSNQEDVYADSVEKRKTIIEEIKNNHRKIKELDEKLKDDEEIMLAAIEGSEYAFWSYQGLVDRVVAFNPVVGGNCHVWNQGLEQHKASL